MATPRKHPRKVAPHKRYLLDRHPQRDGIIRAIVRGTSHREIARKYPTLSHDAISRYLRTRLLEQAGRELAKRDQSAGAVLLDEIEAVKAKLQKLLQACDEYLTDPERPERYTLIPHAHELDVMYSRQEQFGETKSGKPKYRTVLHRESLKHLIDLAMKTAHGDFIQVKYKHADPRKLIVDTAEALTRQLELVAKVQGQIPNLTADITRSQAWLEVKGLILVAVRGHPEVLEKIVAAIEASGAT